MKFLRDWLHTSNFAHKGRPGFLNTAHQWLLRCLHPCSPSPTLEDCPFCQDTRCSANDFKPERKSTLVSAIVVATSIGIGVQSSLRSTSNSILHITNQKKSPAIAILASATPADVKVFADRHDCPVPEVTYTRGNGDADSDNNADSTLSFPPRSIAPFAFAGIGPSVVEKIDYDYLQDSFETVSLRNAPDFSTLELDKRFLRSTPSYGSSCVSSCPSSASLAAEDRTPQAICAEVYSSVNNSSAWSMCCRGDELHASENSSRRNHPSRRIAKTATICHGSDVYTILGPLGEGGFGNVLLAMTRNNERIAIKVVSRDNEIQESSDGVTVPQERDIMERITLAGVSFLTQLLSSWEDEDNIYLVMRAYEETLDQRLYRRAFSPEEMKLYAAELVLALNNLHNLNIMHSDIKPSNILFDSEGHLVLADFGLAQTPPKAHIPLKDCTAYGRVGTPEYMAPEVFFDTREKGHNSKADIWSLGVVFLEMALHRADPYFMAKDKAHMSCRLRFPVFPFHEIRDANLRDLISKMLVHDPRFRISVEELLDHSYFAEIDFDRLEALGYHLSFVPPLSPSVITDDSIESSGLNAFVYDQHCSATHPSMACFGFCSNARHTPVTNSSHSEDDIRQPSIGITMITPLH